MIPDLVLCHIQLVHKWRIFSALDRNRRQKGMPVKLIVTSHQNAICCNCLCPLRMFRLLPLPLYRDFFIHNRCHLRLPSCSGTSSCSVFVCLHLLYYFFFLSSSCKKDGCAASILRFRLLLAPKLARVALLKYGFYISARHLIRTARCWGSARSTLCQGWNFRLIFALQHQQ